MKSPFGAALTLLTTRLSLALAGLLGVALCSIRLLGIWGAESALILGIVLPPLAAAIGARLVAAERRNGQPADASQLLCGAISASVALLIVPVLMLGLNALRVKNCAPLEGLAFIILGPGFGLLLAAVIGVLIAVALPWPTVATAAAIAVPIGSLCISAYSLYTTPAVFAYGHFFGFYHGSLYDEELSIPISLFVLRMGTLLWGLGFLSLLAGLYDRERIRLFLKPTFPYSIFFIIWAAVSITGGAITSIYQEQLGLNTSSLKIANALGGRIDGRICTVVFPRELDRTEAQRLSRDCDFRVRQIETWLGVRQREQITAYFFRSPESKRELMGAAYTNIAKPWRNEVYLLLRPWPHPVLKHEIAHVVAKNAGRGPFGVSGRLGGVWPNPTLIEGLAVAAAWQAENGMTPHQWARAMLEAGLAPPLKEVVGTTFLLQPKHQAYTLAGSLMRYVAEKYGSPMLKRIYEKGDIASALPISFEQLQRQWRAEIMRVPLASSARELARVTFSSKSIFSETCPHQVALLRARLDDELAANNPSGTMAACREILKVNPEDAAARVALVSSLAKNGRWETAQQELNRLVANTRTPAALLVAAKTALGDAAWRENRAGVALEIYRSLLGQPLFNETIRILEVKISAISAGGAQSSLLRDLLLGKESKGADGALAVHIARELRPYRQDGLPFYLEGRQLFFARSYERAANLFFEAQKRGFSTERLAVEAARLEAIARFAAGNRLQSEKLWKSLLRTEDIALSAEASDWLARIADSRNEQ